MPRSSRSGTTPLRLLVGGQSLQLDLPGGSISGYALVKGDPRGMSDEEAPGLRAGAKRTNDLRTPPRHGFGALAEHEGDTEEEDEREALATDLNTTASGLASAQAERGQITPIPGHRYPAASPAHRREDVSMGLPLPPAIRHRRPARTLPNPLNDRRDHHRDVWLSTLTH